MSHETKFTPGPWEQWVGHGNVFAGPLRNNSEQACSIGRGQICECDEDHPNASADTALIAAAPDLYECAFLDDTLVQIEMGIIGASTGMQRFIDAGFDNGNASSLSETSVETLAARKAIYWLNDKRSAALKKARGEIK